MEQSRIIGLSKSVVPRFLLAMARIPTQYQRLVKENLLGFRLDDIMLVRALPRVPLVPIKANYFPQVDHGCILSSYTGKRMRANKSIQSDQRTLSCLLQETQKPRQNSLAPHQYRHAVNPVLHAAREMLENGTFVWSEDPDIAK